MRVPLFVADVPFFSSLNHISTLVLPEHGEERIAPVDTLRSNKMVFGNNHAYQRGQEDQNKILTDHFLFIIIIESLRVHLGRSEHHGQRHRRCPPTARNCDHNAPLSPWRACDRIKGDVSAPFARTVRIA